MPRRRSRSLSRRRLGKTVQVESLEQRIQPAGNVSVAFSGGNLTLRGDSTHNSVSIVPTDDGFEVVGNPDMGIGSGQPTTVNGQASVQFEVDSNSIPGNLTASMGDGVDDLYLRTAVGRNVKVNMGDGRDWFSASETVGRNLNVKLGGDFDIFRLVGNTVEGNVNLNAGSGVGDDISIYEATIQGNLKVKAGSGGQGVRVTRTTVEKRASFSLGNGDDMLNLIDSNFSSFKANGGSGSDLFDDDQGQWTGKNFER